MWYGDWSSDVCSSDLHHGGPAPRAPSPQATSPQQAMVAAPPAHFLSPPPHFVQAAPGPFLPYIPALQQPRAPQQPVQQARLWTPWSGSWDQQSLASNFSTVSLNHPAITDWVMDSGASSHMTPDSGNISLFRPPRSSSIVVGNGSTLPVTASGQSVLPRPFFS